ncbi:hypothetical protein AKO1_008275 [Acrasis kona]|uniref:Dynein axonemal assembly factor 11-like CS domain-containing protein n=1 Tax=Acrasis kona TaxID=1008807 RepID=A0AAW2YMS5_9EUKA
MWRIRTGVVGKGQSHFLKLSETNFLWIIPLQIYYKNVEMVQETLNENLLRRRSEHNDGRLSDLKEITLHQFELTKIEPVLHEHCRQLQQLFLQNNLIEKIENLYHLKDLRYLNLAINSITKIENLESNEVLTKLDLTINYITDIFSVENLSCNHHLRELTLTGNPICNIKAYRLFVISVLPQLKILDGEEIKLQERILAEQNKDDLRLKIKKRQERLLKDTKKEVEKNKKLIESGEDLYGNDPESRRAAAEKMRQSTQEKDNRQSSASGIGEIERINQDVAKRSNLTPEQEIEKYGKVMQKNEGKWDFKLLETDFDYTCDIPIQKHISMANIKINVETTYLRVDVRGKILQIRLDSNVDPDRCNAKRSAVTGALLITMPKNKIVQK